MSEKCKVAVVEEMIRLSHYVLDLSTIVHLMKTKSHFHSNFEEDLDNVVDDILPKISIEINRNIKDDFFNDAYGEADKRAKNTLKKFYFPILNLYGADTRNDAPKAGKKFSNGEGLDLATEIIQNACQNMADFWMYTVDVINVEMGMYEWAITHNIPFSL